MARRLAVLAATAGLVLAAGAAAADEEPCPNATGFGVYVCTSEDGTPYVHDEVTPGGADHLVAWAEGTVDTAGSAVSDESVVWAQGTAEDQAAWAAAAGGDLATWAQSTGGDLATWADDLVRRITG